MNIDVNNVSNRNKTKFSQTVLVVCVLLIFVIVVIAINVISVNKLQQKVAIVHLKESVAQNQRISESNLEEAYMYAAEFKNVGTVVLSDGTERSAVVRWEERDRIIGGYAAHYLRKGTAIYWDSLTRETTKKNSYLYKMDGELVKLDVSADVFGDMVVPGDRVNIRCIYTEQSYKLPTVAEYEAMNQLGLTMNNTEEKQVKLFSNVAILDMLNSDGESIFDIYYELTNLSTAQQQATIKTDEFRSKTAPSQILLCVTEEEADMYMRIQNKQPTYMLTLLPREGSNLILDALAALQDSTT